MEGSKPAAEQIEVRRLTSEDASAFYALRLEALEQEPQAFSSSPEEHRALTQTAIAHRLGSNPEQRSLVLAAFVHGAPIAMAGFFLDDGPKTRHRGRIWGVYVNRHWRRKGIARALLTEIIRRAKAWPELEQIALAVASNQDAARELYLSMGFEIYGRDPHAMKIGDNYLDEDLMLLRLREAGK
jgi:ribosomal protein S18 acetylase RimI-like enzyme